MNKAAEQLLDFAGLFGDYEIAKLKAEAAAKGTNPNPEIQRSQTLAGMVPWGAEGPVGWAQRPENRVPLYVIGGIAAVGLIAAITIASTRKG